MERSDPSDDSTFCGEIEERVTEMSEKKTRFTHLTSKRNSSLPLRCKAFFLDLNYTAHNLFLTWAAHRFNFSSRVFVLLVLTVSLKAPHASGSWSSIPLIRCPQIERSFLGQDKQRYPPRLSQPPRQRLKAPPSPI